MRILILGGTRFIGPPVVRRLARGGHNVTLFHRGQNEPELPDSIRHIHGERVRLDDFEAEFQNTAPEVVLDMMACTQEDGERLVRMFAGRAGRLVVISSADVYRAYDRLRGADTGPPDPAPLTEESPLRDQLFPYREQSKEAGDFLSRYDKILMERAAAAAADLPVTVLRLPMVYGPGDYQHRLFPYLKRMDDGRGKLLVSAALQGWHGLRGHVEDIGDAIARCVTDPRASGRVYNVADEVPLTEPEWIRRIGRAAGWDGEVVALPNERLPTHLKDDYDYGQDWSLDSSRIRRELDYRETTAPDEAMARTIAWERANPPATVDPAQFDYAAEDAALATAG